MTSKILLLCLVLDSSFKEFVEFSFSSAAQLLKLRLQIQTSLKQTFLQQPFANIIFEFVTYIILTRNLTLYPKYQIYTLN